MAVNLTDELSVYLGSKRHDPRQDVWLWLFLQTHHEAEFKPEECDSLNMRNLLASHLRGRRFSLDTITSAMTQFLVNADHLKWITEDERQTHWLVFRLEDITQNHWLKRLPNLVGRDLVTGMIDIWNVPTRDKTRILSQLREDWLYQKNLDHQFKWFEEKGESKQRCKFAWVWMQKNASSLTSDALPFENYPELIMFFDKADLREAERTLIAQNIRRAWTRRKYVEKMGTKKQCNTFLPEETINLLDGLVEKHGLKRPQILEILIQMESEQGAYIAHSAGQVKNSPATSDT